MPDRPDQGPETVAALHEVTTQLASLDAKLGQAERQTRRRLAALALAVAAVLAAITVAAVITFNATLDRQRHDILVCFLRPGAVTAQVAAACDRKFSGTAHEYRAVQQQGQANLRTFTDMQRRLDRVERRLAELQE